MGRHVLFVIKQRRQVMHRLEILTRAIPKLPCREGSLYCPNG